MPGVVDTVVAGVTVVGGLSVVGGSGVSRAQSSLNNWSPSSSARERERDGCYVRGENYEFSSE